MGGDLQGLDLHWLIAEVKDDECVTPRSVPQQFADQRRHLAVTSGHATTGAHERPPAAWDTKPEAHQEDVPTSPTDTQNVFLCRDPRFGLSQISWPTSVAHQA